MPSKKTTTTNAAYLPPPDGGDLEAAGTADFIDYEDKKRRMELWLFMVADGVFEVSNEGTDVYFAFDELQFEDPLLFDISMGFLGATLLLRLMIALAPLRQVLCSEQLKFKSGRVIWYVLGVLLSLVEPMSGSQLIGFSIDDKAGGAWNEHDRIQKARKLQNESRVMLRNSWAMVLVEDIPEFVIQMAYLYRSGGRIKNAPLFVVDIFFTVLHLLRVGAEIWFEMTHAKHIAKQVEIESSDTAALTELVTQMSTRCHKICSVKLQHFSGEASKQVGRFAAFMVKSSKSLGWMELHGSDIGDGFGIEIAKGLARNTTLSFLSLEGNQLTDATGKELATALKQNDTLTALGLGSNQLTDATGKELATALKQNTTLTSLFLYDNQLTDATGKELATALKQNTTLTKLSLEGNQLTDATGKELATALKQNATLTSLFLDGNQLTDATKTAIRKAWGNRSNELYL